MVAGTGLVVYCVAGAAAALGASFGANSLTFWSPVYFVGASSGSAVLPAVGLADLVSTGLAALGATGLVALESVGLAVGPTFTGFGSVGLTALTGFAFTSDDFGAAVGADESLAGACSITVMTSPLSSALTS